MFKVTQFYGYDFLKLLHGEQCSALRKDVGNGQERGPVLTFASDETVNVVGRYGNRKHADTQENGRELLLVTAETGHLKHQINNGDSTNEEHRLGLYWERTPVELHHLLFD